MKKLLALLLALLLVLSLAACAAKDDDDSSDRDKTTKSDREDRDKETQPDDDEDPDRGPDEDPGEDDEADTLTYGTVDEPDPFGPEVLELIASAGEDTAERSGTCGEGLSWYYLDNVLVIRGKGDMENYSFSSNTAPWSTFVKRIELVYLDDGVTSVGKYPFLEMGSLRGVYIPNSVTSIGDGAFKSCENLTYVRCSKNLTELGYSAFEQTGLRSFSIPRGIAKIAKYVFKDSDLASVEFPDGVTEIGAAAFSGCKLPSVTVPDGVTTIGNQAFGFMHSLETVTFPASVTSMGPAFAYSDPLTVTFLGDAPEMEDDYGLLLGLKKGSTIQYSGDGFDWYIEDYPDYYWVKQ